MFLVGGALDGGVDGKKNDEEQEAIENTEDGRSTGLGVRQARTCNKWS